MSTLSCQVNINFHFDFPSTDQRWPTGMFSYFFLEMCCAKQSTATNLYQWKIFSNKISKLYLNPQSNIKLIHITCPQIITKDILDRRGQHTSLPLHFSLDSALFIFQLCRGKNALFLLFSCILIALGLHPQGREGVDCLKTLSWMFLDQLMQGSQ